MSMENKDNNMEYEDYETELNDLNLQLSGNSTPHGWINAKGEEKKDANLMDMFNLSWNLIMIQMILIIILII